MPSARSCRPCAAPSAEGERRYDVRQALGVLMRGSWLMASDCAPRPIPGNDAVRKHWYILSLGERRHLA